MNEYLEFFTIDKWTLIFTWVNLLVMFTIVKKLLFKPVNKIMEQRKQEIDGTYSQAQEAKENALAMEKEYTQKIALAKDEAGNILKNATVNAHKREEEIIGEAKARAAAIAQRAQTEIEQEKKKAYEEIKGEIADISVSIAEKIIEREINAKDHEALIAEFIQNVGEA